MKIEGRIFELPRITAIVSTVAQLSGNVGAKTINVGGRPYEGDYIVTPKVDQQKLDTKDAIMRDDVTILAIPYFETSNNSGGNTVYIAKEI